MTPRMPHRATAFTVLAQNRITKLATSLPTHRAFHWLHLHQSQMRVWQLEMLAIPAPTFHESARAIWFIQRFSALGLSNVHVDEAGNVLGELAPENPDAPKSFVLVSAHLDTVFPVGTDTHPTEDGDRILGPGACDNAAGLTALLGLIAAIRFANIRPPTPILFAANVCEEGEGNLRGMRHIFESGSYRGRIAASIALEGSGTGIAVTNALGSIRFRLTVRGPGGHSWADADMPNPITLLSRAIVKISEMEILAENQNGAPASTFNPGVIQGGTSVNSIPESASALLDFRATEQVVLERIGQELPAIVDSLIAAPASFSIEVIGNRPAAILPPDSPLLDSLRAVDRHLGIRTELRLGSTDANIPLSMGVPAAALASGGTGGGIHTLAEWYDPTGREVALRRVLLVILDLAQTLLPL